jgi:hypothetical protein
MGTVYMDPTCTVEDTYSVASFNCGEGNKVDTRWKLFGDKDARDADVEATPNRYPEMVGIREDCSDLADDPAVNERGG